MRQSNDHERQTVIDPARRIALTAAAGIVSGLLGACTKTPAVETAIDIPKIAESQAETTKEPTLARRAEPVIAQETPPDDCCAGRNECKGKGNCKIDGVNGCKGQNDCKGKGGCRGSECDEPKPDPAAAQNCCKAMNQCKAMGNCKTSQHNCKGLNACKGQGGCKPQICP